MFPVDGLLLRIAVGQWGGVLLVSLTVKIGSEVGGAAWLVSDALPRAAEPLVDGQGMHRLAG